jgi:hypothetical protein
MEHEDHDMMRSFVVMPAGLPDGAARPGREHEAPPALLAQADLVVKGPPGLRELLRRLAS